MVWYLCARGEMDITAGFGPAVLGSNPGGRTRGKAAEAPEKARGAFVQDSKPC